MVAIAPSSGHVEQVGEDCQPRLLDCTNNHGAGGRVKQQLDMEVFNLVSRANGVVDNDGEKIWFIRQVG